MLDYIKDLSDMTVTLDWNSFRQFRRCISPWAHLAHAACQIVSFSDDNAHNSLPMSFQCLLNACEWLLVAAAAPLLSALSEVWSAKLTHRSAFRSHSAPALIHLDPRAEAEVTVEAENNMLVWGLIMNNSYMKRNLKWESSRYNFSTDWKDWLVLISLLFVFNSACDVGFMVV